MKKFIYNLQMTFDTLLQKTNVSFCPFTKTWVFINGGIMRDGYKTKFAAWIAARKYIFRICTWAFYENYYED